MIGQRKLRELSAADVRQAWPRWPPPTPALLSPWDTSRLSAPSGMRKPTTSSAGTSRPWLIPRRARRGGHPKSMTVDQAVAVIAAARVLPAVELRPGLKDARRPAALMYAYIVLSLLAGVPIPKRPGRCAGSTWSLMGILTLIPLSRLTWPCGPELVLVQVGVPDVHRAHLREPGHCLPVGPHRRQRRRAHIGLANPLLRPAIAKLAAIRFTSNSNGPGSVSSKSFTSNSSLRRARRTHRSSTGGRRRTAEPSARRPACPPGRRP